MGRGGRERLTASSRCHRVISVFRTGLLSSFTALQYSSPFHADEQSASADKGTKEKRGSLTARLGEDMSVLQMLGSRRDAELELIDIYIKTYEKMDRGWAMLLAAYSDLLDLCSYL